MSNQTTVPAPRTNALTAWRSPLGQLRREMRDWMAGFLPDNDETWFGAPVPSLDLSETPEAVQVRMDVPGVKAADLDVQVNGNLLTISGKREEEKEEKNRTYHRVERSSGSFSRTVTLPCAVEEAKVDAQYKDGILTVALPKTPEAKSRKIEVKS
jgi:HSP20 family protein